jgi:hypothetical protein
MEFLRQYCAYDRAFKSNVATAMTSLSYSALMEQTNNKYNQFMNYMELSCNENFNDNMQAKFGCMADAALEAANKMERQNSKQIAFDKSSSDDNSSSK